MKTLKERRQHKTTPIQGSQSYKIQGRQATRERNQDHGDCRAHWNIPKALDVFLLAPNGWAPLVRSHQLHSCHLSLVYISSYLKVHFKDRGEPSTTSSLPETAGLSSVSLPLSRTQYNYPLAKGCCLCAPSPSLSVSCQPPKQLTLMAIPAAATYGIRYLVLLEMPWYL